MPPWRRSCCSRTRSPSSAGSAAGDRLPAGRGSPAVQELHQVEDLERGSAVVWLLLIVPVLFVFGALVLDGGRVITARQHAANVAEQAARSAVDELNHPTFRGAFSVTAVDLSAARAAACRYAATAGPTSSCSATLAGGQVRVDVTVTTRTAMLSAVGISRITVAGTGQARPAVGSTQEVPQ